MNKYAIKGIISLDNYYRILKRMKITAFFLFLGIFFAQAGTSYSQDTKLALNLRSVTVREVCKQIEEQSNYIFVFSDNAENELNKKVNILVESQNIEEVLDAVLSSTNLSYRILDKQVVVYHDNEKKTGIIVEPSPAPQPEQTRTITGKVTDTSGEPLPGATVMVKSTTIGTVTDADGNYLLSNVPDDAILVFSFVGMQTQEIEVGNRTRIDVTLQEETIALQEVVAVGYGTMRKSDVTGSVVSVSSEEMLKRNPINLGQGLQGVAPGVMVLRNSGDPAGDVTIRIRGVATINNSADPLFVVDGIPMGTSIDFLNPNDIESIEILKDASATAIYGSQGANGVILVSTKKGMKGATKMNFSANLGVQNLAYKFDMLDAEHFVLAARRAAENDGNVLTNEAWIMYDKELNNIDWQDEMTHSAFQQNYNLNILGGSETTQAAMSLGYLNNDGIIINSNFQRFTTHASIDHKIKEFFRTGINLSYMHSERYGGGNLVTYASVIPTMDVIDEKGNLINVPIRYPDGTWGHFKREGNGDVNKGQDNPVAEARTRDEKNYSNRLIANGYLDLDIVEGLVFRAIAGLNYRADSYRRYNMRHERTFLAIGRPDEFYISQAQDYNLSLESYLTYDLNINDVHRVNLMAGYSASSYKPQNVNASASDFPAENIRRIELTGNKGTINAGGGLGRESRSQSFFGRINYSLLDRYLLTTTLRRDGSSNFGSGNRYGNFPSFALGWRVSEEEFMKNLDLFSNMKLRFGWGQTGNAGYSTNLSVNQLSSDRIAYYFFVNGSHEIAPGVAQLREIDTNLKWETNEQTNIGLDLGFLNNSLNFSFDYFIRDTKDLLLYRPVRPSTGYVDIYTNAGHIRNSGVEFSVSYQQKINNWSLDIRFNGATLKNKAIDVGNDIYFDEDVATGDYWDNYSLTRNGYPVGSFYGWRVESIFQSQKEIDDLNAKVAPEDHGGYYQSASTQPGDFKYKDLNRDGWIDDKDREILGDGYPKLNFGLNVNLGYKNWDFSLFSYGVLGQEILSYAYKNLTSMYVADGGYRNVLKKYGENAWTPENKSNKYPRLTKQDANHNGQVSDAFLKNGDFLKIQNVQIGYTIPKKMIENIKLENLRLFMSVDNLFTLTGYEAGEPEVGTNKVLQTGFDGGRYPFPRTISFGLSLDL
ncbi:MAG: SusC/RagA family TonB-linked outer membrane protein [Bacteroidales bacterium]